MILELLQSTLSGSVVDQIGQQANLDTQSTQTVLSDVLPTLLGGLAQNTQNKSKEQDLAKALQEDHTGNLLKTPEAVTTPEQIEDGQKILEHIFGENQGQVVDVLQNKLGVDSSSIQSVMAMAAPLVLEHLGKETIGNTDTSVGQILQQERPNIENSLGQLANSFFDQNKNGTLLDEIFNFIKGLFGR